MFETPTTPQDTMIRAMDDNRRLRKFIESQPISEVTNKLYQQTCEMMTEMYEAFQFTMSLI